MRSWRNDSAPGSCVTPDAPETTLSDIAALLRRQRVPFALVGGLAVSIRGEVRFTRDVDIAVSVDGDEPFHLILVNPSLALDEVRALLAIIARRGFDRGEDLPAKLGALLDEVALQRP